MSPVVTIQGVFSFLFCYSFLMGLKSVKWKVKTFLRVKVFFTVRCFTSLSTVLLPENPIVKSLVHAYVGVCCFLSTHYYDCSGTMGWSEVMLIASDQDNTVAYGRTNTMRGHFFTNKALPSPPPALYTVPWMTEQGQYWHRKPEELNQNKNNHTTVFCP